MVIEDTKGESEIQVKTLDSVQKYTNKAIVFGEISAVNKYL